MPGLLVVAATDRELCGVDGLVCGVGPVEAAAATARALALRPFEAVLHVGLAGGRGIPVGSLVVGTEAVYCDLAAEWPVVDRALPDGRLVEAARSALPTASALPIHTSAAVGAAGDTVAQGPAVEAREGVKVEVVRSRGEREAARGRVSQARFDAPARVGPAHVGVHLPPG